MSLDERGTPGQRPKSPVILPTPQGQGFFVNQTKDCFPWDKHEVTPEARELTRRMSAEANLDRLDRENPPRLRHYVLLGLGGLALVAVPLLLLSLMFDLSSLLGRFF